MNSYSIDTQIKNGHLELNNVPFSNDIDVRVLIIPKVNLSKMSFNKILKTTKLIKGNISDDINKARDGK